MTDRRDRDRGERERDRDRHRDYDRDRDYRRNRSKERGERDRDYGRARDRFEAREDPNRDYRSSGGRGDYSRRRWSRSPDRDRHVEEPKSGLKSVEIHPLLAANIDLAAARPTTIPLIPKADTSSSLANQRAALKMEPKAYHHKREKTEAEVDRVAAFLAIKPTEQAEKNPYFDRRLAVGAKRHVPRALQFHQKGLFIAQGNQMRREAQMEALKREIAETTLSAGLDVEIVSDMLALQQTPVVEWWDLPFLPSGTFDDIQQGTIRYELLNQFIQRPALIQPPADLNVIVPPKPLALTKEEQKKMRRQRRLQEQKEKQEKIRLGLIPPEPAKVKVASIKNVLASDSVQEPSRVEAEIRAQAQARHEAHLKANEERKAQAEQAAKPKPAVGPVVQACVYQVDRLDRKQWKYKININAKQDSLTGCCIVSPRTNLIVVEGAPKGLKHFKALVTRRINWNEEPADSDNQCRLLWEGPIVTPSWRWFEMKEMPADIDVKEYFSKLGLDQYWNLSRSTSQ